MSLADSPNDPFVRWLIENLDGVQNGTATYRGLPVTRETMTTQFHAVFSCLVATFKHPSTFFLVDVDSTNGTAILYTLLSVLCGWWGIPWGPVFTIEAVIGNLFGGKRRSVGDLIDEITGHRRNVVRLTKRAATHARRHIAEQGYPPDTALFVRVEEGLHTEYRIEYDYPESDGRQWRGESFGLTILVDKESTCQLDGLIVDCEDGQYAFQMTSKAP